MSVPDCFAKLSATLGDHVPKKTLRDLAQDLSREQAQNLSPEAFEARANDIYLARLARDAAQRRTMRLMNLQTAEKLSSVMMQEIKGMSAGEKVLATINGDAKRMGNAMNKSIEGSRNGMTSTWMKDVRSALADNRPVAEQGFLTKEITQDMAALENKTNDFSGNKQALDIAKVYHGVLADIYNTKKAYNPFLGRILDWFYRGSHDQVKVSAVPRDQWVDIAMQRFGEKSYPELEGQEKADKFGAVYDQIKAGTYESMLNMGESKADIAYRQSASRSLIPNSWQDFHEYNQQFGVGNVHSAVLRTIETSAHNIAVMQKFGSTPQEGLNSALSLIAKSGDEKAIASVESYQKRIQDAFDSVTQFSRSPGTSGKARTTRGLMQGTNLAVNGAHVLKALGDIPNMALKMHDLTGQSYLGSFAEAAGEFLKQFSSSGEARQVAKEEGMLFSRSLVKNLNQDMGYINSNPTPQNMVEGLLTKGIELQSHLSLAERFTSSIDSAIANTQMRALGKMTETDFKDLHPQTVAELRRYGIGEHEWPAIQQGHESWSHLTSPEEGDTSKMLNVDSLRNIPDEAIDKMLIDSGQYKGDPDRLPPAMRVRARMELQGSIGSLITDSAQASNAQLSQAKRSQLLGNHDPDSNAALARQLLMQFKSAMVANVNTVARSYYSNPLKPQGDFTKVALHMIMVSGMYTFGEALKEAAQGKKPEMTPQLAINALADSGALGYAGSSILSDGSRVENGNANDVGKSILQNMAGPVIGNAVRGVGLAYQTAQSAFSDKTKFPAGQLGQFAQQQTPFPPKLFYTAGVFNYLYAHSIMDWMAPGYMGHQIKRQEKQDGTQYWLNPGE